MTINAPLCSGAVSLRSGGLHPPTPVWRSLRTLLRNVAILSRWAEIAAESEVIMVRKKWCVRHRGGWCATSRKTPPPDDVANQRTVCRHYVVLPWGIEWRRPTCPDCIAVLTKSKESAATVAQQAAGQNDDTSPGAA
jgi:hypothetical protein